MRRFNALVLVQSADSAAGQEATNHPHPVLRTYCEPQRLGCTVGLSTIERLGLAMLKPIGATEVLGLAEVQSDHLDRDERSPWA
jgi:hypothetical protein